MKRVIVRYTDRGRGDRLAPALRRHAQEPRARPAGLPRPRLGACPGSPTPSAWPARRSSRLQRAGRVADGDFMDWYKRVAEIEPRLSHKDVDDLLATGTVQRAEADYLHKRVEELGDGAGESQAPPSL